MESILVVDDSLVQGMALRNILEQEYHVEICRSGEEALEKAPALLPSLILLDVIMQGMNGFETLVRLKELSATQNIPVILITSLSDVGNEEKGLSLGAVDYIVKPFNPSIVQARVRTHTQLYSYRRTFEALAMIDGMTGIPNRRYYEKQSKAEWFRAMRDQRPLSIGLMDVDFFKQYNDLYGHPNGDEALIRVAHILAGSLHRSSDFSARYGGEEFIFLLPNTPIESAKQIAGEICRKIEALHIPHEGSKHSVLTVSIGGVTVIPSKDQDFVDCVQTVDKMLYRAKESGRNMVIWSE